MPREEALLKGPARYEGQSKLQSVPHARRWCCAQAPARGSAGGLCAGWALQVSAGVLFWLLQVRLVPVGQLWCRKGAAEAAGGGLLRDVDGQQGRCCGLLLVWEGPSQRSMRGHSAQEGCHG